MGKKAEDIFGEFERTIDEFFNELLIDRWRSARGDRFEQTEVIDHPDHYEVRVITEAVDPAKLEVESLGQRVVVRAPMGANRTIESSFRFSESVDSDSATAKWSNRMLTITVPKRKARRIHLKES